MSKPSHATVVAYLALLVALGTSGAYAVDRITGAQIQDGTIRSTDLKNRRAVTGADVRPDALTGEQVREEALDAAPLVPLAGVNDAGDCDPSGASASDCVAVEVELGHPTRLMVIATGGMYGDGTAPPVRAGCDIRVDGSPRPAFATPGEEVDTSSSGATDGFARTLVTDNPVRAGTHKVALACRELDPDVRIATPTIAVLGVSSG